MTAEQKYYATLIVLGSIAFLMMIGMIVYSIYSIITNEKNYKKFRKNLKIGDQTNCGTVTNIDPTGTTITIQIEKDIQFVYPPENRGKIYRYPEQK